MKMNNTMVKGKRKSVLKQNDVSEHVISFRVTSDEYNHILKEVSRLGAKNISEFVRSAVLRKDIEVVNVFHTDPAKIEELQILNKEIRKVGININQIAHIANTNKMVDDVSIASLSQNVIELSRLCKDLLSEANIPFKSK